MPELPGVPAACVDDNRLYRALDPVLPHKEQLEKHLKQRLGEQLKKMAARCQKQKRDPMKVEREVGRLLGQNTRAARLFHVDVKKTDDGSACLSWKKLESKREWATLSAGCYLLRSNLDDWTDEQLWKAYIQLTEAEAAFRIQKTDLRIRSVWHQQQERVLAHILVCFLGDVLWKTLGQLCERAGLGNEPRRVLAELSELRLVDVVLPISRRPRDPQALHHPPFRPSSDPARPSGT